MLCERAYLRTYITLQTPIILSLQRKFFKSITVKTHEIAASKSIRFNRISMINVQNALRCLILALCRA